MKTKQESEFDESLFKKDIENLIKSGYFKKVSYNVETKKDGVEISIIVEENPVIEKITFNGNKTFKTKKIKEFFGIEEGEILNEIKIKEGIEKIKENYSKKGFLIPEIDYLVEEKDGKCTVNVSIKEKGKGYVRKILFEGNNSFKSKKLKGLMKIKERKMPFRRGIYKEEIIQQDIERIKDFYRENGFIQVDVKKEIKSYQDGIEVKILINEGERYYVGDIKIEGNLIFPENEIRKFVLLKKGEIFNEKKNNQTIKKILNFYMDNGYIRASVDFLPEIDGNLINITYLIQPREIYYAQDIKIKGNTKTKDKVIRREIMIEPGEKITAKEIRKSFNRLRDTNYFEDIQIYPEIIDQTKANLVVSVKEREKTGLFLIGGGYSSVDKFIGLVSIQQTNFDISNPPKFVGGGQRLSLSFEIGTTARNYSISFTEPYLFDKPVYFGPDIYRLTREWDEWTTETTGFDLRIGRRWENYTLGFKLLTENVKLSEIEIPSIRSQEGEKRKNSITSYFTYSNLESERFPNKGDKLQLSLEYAGFGGDVDFVKTILENHFYYPFEKIIFHSKTLVGIISEDIEEIPIYERFFGGGIGTVRGYKERSLGPREEGYSLGGKVIIAQNFEMLYPLYKDIMYGILFFDFGNVYKEWDGLSDFKKGVGAGIRVNVPVFNAPIEVYYGYGLDAEPGESKSRIHIGMSFGF